MTVAKTYLLSVLVTALLLRLAEGLFPAGKFRALGNLVCGLVLLCVMLQPLRSGVLPGWEGVQSELDLQFSDTAALQQEELAAVISEKTAAYIQNKAASQGIICRPEVGCTDRDGVPFPTEVWMDIPYDAALSQQITADLAIDRQHQYWKESP